MALALARNMRFVPSNLIQVMDVAKLFCQQFAPNPLESVLHAGEALGPVTLIQASLQGLSSLAHYAAPASESWSPELVRFWPDIEEWLDVLSVSAKGPIANCESENSETMQITLEITCFGVPSRLCSVGFKMQRQRFERFLPETHPRAIGRDLVDPGRFTKVTDQVSVWPDKDFGTLFALIEHGPQHVISFPKGLSEQNEGFAIGARGENTSAKEGFTASDAGELQ